jgi:hypothetical protein
MLRSHGIPRGAFTITTHSIAYEFKGCSVELRLSGESSELLDGLTLGEVGCGCAKSGVSQRKRYSASEEMWNRLLTGR